MYIKKINKLGIDNLASNLTTKDFNFEALNNNQIYVLDKDNSLIAIKTLKNPYKIFTFNDNIQEYIMMNENGTFNRVNTNLEETNELKISKPNKLKVNDVFFDKLNNRYLLADNQYVYSNSINGDFLKNEVNIDDFYTIRTTISCGCPINKIVPSDFAFTAVGSDENGKYIAYNKNNSAYLALVSENGSKASELFIGDNLKVNSIAINDGIFLNVTKGNDDYLYEISLSDGGSVSPQIEDIISNLNTLIDKIGSSEAQIGTLIQTEADKVRKVLNETTDLNLILQTNASVSDVVSGLANIELSEKDNLNLIIEAIMELQKIIREENQ